jgi:predicted N-acetyltransferase YhbS
MANIAAPNPAARCGAQAKPNDNWLRSNNSIYTLLGDSRTVEIQFLADRPEFIPQLAEWHFREWAYLRPDDSVANRVRLLRERSGRTELPITFIASSGAELLGSAMLIHREMDTHPQFTPWLAGVFVALAHRGRGIGSALAEHVVREAAARGYPTIYLFTPSAQDFFSRLGWRIVEHAPYRDTDVTIMSHIQVT